MGEGSARRRRRKEVRLGVSFKLNHFDLKHILFLPQL